MRRYIGTETEHQSVHILVIHIEMILFGPMAGENLPSWVIYYCKCYIKFWFLFFILF